MRMLFSLSLLWVISTAAAQAPKTQPKPDCAELAKEYIYPGATKHGASYGGGNVSVFLATFVTTDDHEKVINWYMQKIANQDKPRIDGITWVGDGGSAVKQDTHSPPEAKGADPKRRPVAVSVLTKRWHAASVTVVVSRAENERHTHIVLTLLRNPMK